MRSSHRSWQRIASVGCDATPSTLT
jgi:hypothetical protein